MILELKIIGKKFGGFKYFAYLCKQLRREIGFRKFPLLGMLL
nr:MAG TPA: hypothetical protein [Crassvirales sp.]